MAESEKMWKFVLPELIPQPHAPAKMQPDEFAFGQLSKVFAIFGI
jgi:hypothetical protein